MQFQSSNPIRRHSGAPRSGEPGIHNHRLGVWIPALARYARSAGMTEVAGMKSNRTCIPYDVGQSGSGSPSSQTKIATEKTIITAASARVSSARTSRAA